MPFSNNLGTGEADRNCTERYPEQAAMALERGGMTALALSLGRQNSPTWSLHLHMRQRRGNPTAQAKGLG